MGEGPCVCNNQLQPHDRLEACREVVARYDNFTQPSGDALLRDLHEVLDPHPYEEELNSGGEG